MPTVIPSTRIQLAAGSVNCDPPKVDQERCPTPPKSAHKPKPVVKKAVAPTLGITECDQLFIDGKINEDEWKEKCFTPGSLKFQRKEQWLQQLEDRKQVEASRRGLSPFQIRIGTALTGGKSLYRDVYKNWNVGATFGEFGTLAGNAMPKSSNDAVVDKGNHFGARFTIASGPGLARFTDSTLIEFTFLDLALYDLSSDSFNLDKLDRGALGKVDVYHAVSQYGFFNWSIGVIERDTLWQKMYAFLAPIQLGFAYQLLGTPFGEDRAIKTVLQHDDFLQNYLLLGAKFSLAFESTGQGLSKVTYTDTKRPFCSLTQTTTSDHCTLLISILPEEKAFQQASFGNEFYVSTYLKGEMQNSNYGLGYKAFADVYPIWGSIEIGANLSLHLTKGHMRILLDGASRKIWTYGDTIIGLPQSAYEYSVQLMLGYLVN